MRCFGWVGAAVVFGCLGGVLSAQGVTTLVEPLGPLLPQSFHGVARSGDAVGGDDPAQADAGRADALKEDGLQRFARGAYGMTKVEALQFNDATGALSAFTLYRKGGSSGPKLDDTADQTAMADGRTIVLKQTVVLIAEQGAESSVLAGVASALPRVSGPRSQAPLLPTFFPAKGLVVGSLRYALGPASYSAMGGTLDAAKLGWEKSAEAAIADYSDRRGRETVTLLLYPTPQIAGDHLRALEAQAGGMKTRREGELVIVAVGTFSADDAQNMIENIHLHNQLSFDKPMPLEFHAELQKTFSLLQSIAILSGAGMLIAVVVGVFLGGGRAMVRKMQGKDAATDAEFLSLHLANQNPPPKFDPPGS
jgi:hypothetical protein